MSLQLSYQPNYYSLDDILATQERVPCKLLQNVLGMVVCHCLFNNQGNLSQKIYQKSILELNHQNVKKLIIGSNKDERFPGKLNPATEEKDVKAGTELELPAWLVASDCSIGRQPIFAPELPKVYKEAYREILKADATAINLHKFNVYFYELGSYVKQFDRKDDVHAILLHTFTTRFRLIMDLAHNSESNPTVEQKLDMLERRIYRAGHTARAKLNRWLLESGVQLQAANMVTNHRKRKRVDDDLFS